MTNVTNMEHAVRRGNEGYVVTDDQGTTGVSFDSVIDEIERITLELVGREVLPAAALDAPHIPARGSMEAWDHLRNLHSQLRRVCSQQGEFAVANLSPQLSGIEGRCVEVIDHDGERRRFVIAKSAGWLPHHLEIAKGVQRRAQMEYASVIEIYPTDKE